LAVKTLVSELLAKMVGGKMKREVFLAAIAEVGATIFENMNAQRGDSHD
jgi:hypothetical protein